MFYVIRKYGILILFFQKKGQNLELSINLVVKNIMIYGLKMQKKQFFSKKLVNVIKTKDKFLL